MTNEFDAHALSEAESLEDLLRDVTDEKERARLEKAWLVFGDCAGKRYAAPPPSKELERIFSKGARGVDEQMSDDELEMLAAAGSVSPQVTDGVTFVPDGGSDGDPGEGDEPATISTNIMFGSDGDDSLTGQHGSDSMRGFGGDDTMLGGDGNDILYGDEGDDRLLGGEGNDTLNGGLGNDVLTGGAGGDLFVFTDGDGEDTITDFNPEEDKLQFHGVNPDSMFVQVEDGNTVIRLGGMVVTLEGVEMTQEEVFACVEEENGGLG